MELVQRIVDGGQRDIDVGVTRFAMQLLGTDMPVRPAEQQLGQRHALPGRAQACHTQYCGKARLSRRQCSGGLGTVYHWVLDKKGPELQPIL
jgi:hypothetical protein